MRQWLRRTWRRLVDRPARHLLMVVGAAMIVGAFVQSANRNDFAKWTIAAGSALLVIGAVVHRIREFGVGTNKVVLEPDVARSVNLAAQVTQERQHRQQVRLDETEILDGSRLFAAETTIGALLTPEPTSLLTGCSFHLYLYDAYLRQLLPAFEPDDDHRAEGWSVGTGVVGDCFRRRRYVVAVAPDTWNDTFDVPADRRARYENVLLAVAAVPVVNAADAVIAVLSASDRAAADRLTTDDAEQHLTTMAYAIARVLIDLLGWFPDRYIDVTEEVPR